MGRLILWNRLFKMEVLADSATTVVDELVLAGEDANELEAIGYVEDAGRSCFVRLVPWSEKPPDGPKRSENSCSALVSNGLHRDQDTVTKHN